LSDASTRGLMMTKNVEEVKPFNKPKPFKFILAIIIGNIGLFGNLSNG